MRCIKDLILFVFVIAAAFLFSGCGRLKENVQNPDIINVTIPPATTNASCVIEPAAASIPDTKATASLQPEVVLASDSEEQFVQSLLDALNRDDVTFLSANYKSIYEETTKEETKALAEGLAFYHEYFNHEALVSIEYAGELEKDYDSPATSGKQYIVKSESGITRDVEIIGIGYVNTEYKFKDDFLLYCAAVIKRTTEYIAAIQSEDIAYLYDYIRISNEDGEALPYSDPDHNKEYAAAAQGLLDRYKQDIDLNTLDYKMSNSISGACNSGLLIDFTLTGMSHSSTAVEHTIQGIFEFPSYGILDSWRE